MKYPNAVYLVALHDADGKLKSVKYHALHLYGHHQDGEHEGEILSTQVQPVEVDGVTYYPKPDEGQAQMKLHRVAIGSNGNVELSEADLKRIATALQLPIKVFC